MKDGRRMRSIKLVTINDLLKADQYACAGKCRPVQLQNFFQNYQYSSRTVNIIGYLVEKMRWYFWAISIFWRWIAFVAQHFAHGSVWGGLSQFLNRIIVKFVITVWMGPRNGEHLNEIRRIKLDADFAERPDCDCDSCVPLIESCGMRKMKF